MKEIIVTDHALSRFKERSSSPADKDRIEKIFRNNVHIMLEPAWRGREIIQVGSWVWVVNKTTAKTVVTTCLGHINDYALKRPNRKGDRIELAYEKWRMQQRRKSKSRL